MILLLAQKQYMGNNLKIPDPESEEDSEEKAKIDYGESTEDNDIQLRIKVLNKLVDIINDPESLKNSHIKTNSNKSQS